MKIIQIINYPGQGGAEQYAFLLAKYAIRDGNKVDFVFGEDGPMVERVKGLGCDVHFVKMRAFYDPFAVTSLVKLFKKLKPDVVHTHFLRENFLAIEASKIIKVPAIFSTVHRLEPKKGLQAYVNKIFSRSLTKFIAVSPLAKQYLLNEGVKESKIVTILNGADVNTKGRQQAINKYGLSKNTTNIGYVGRFTEEKGHKTLIKAFSLLKNLKTKLILVGDGDKREEMENLVKRLKLDDRVVFTGYREKGYEIISACDIYIQPSRIENLPMSVAEAMLLGVPIAASDCPAHKFLLKDGKLGYLFKNKNAKSLAEVLTIAMSDKETSAVHVKAAKDYALLHLSGEKMWNATGQLYEKYAKNHQIVVE